MLSAMLHYPGNYISLLQLSVPGIGALLLALVLGRKEPVWPKLWFLLPLAATYLGTFGLAVLAEAVTGGAKTVGGPMWVWLALYAALVLVPTGWAAYVNRGSPFSAVLLPVFVLSFAVPGFLFFGFALSCGVGCGGRGRAVLTVTPPTPAC